MPRDPEQQALIDRCIDEGKCYVCGKPVVPNVDAMYSITGAHYDCEKGTERSYREAVAKLEAPRGTVTRKRRAREGQGPAARAAIAKAVAAIEAQTGAILSDVIFWNQKGAYRGPHWDLARWGLGFTLTFSADFVVRGSCHSWSPVTLCSKKSVVLGVYAEDMSFTYNVEPK
jgi:hypothetical protein